MLNKGDLEDLRGQLAWPATTLSTLAAEDPAGDAVRWQDVERIIDKAISEAGNAGCGCKGRGYLLVHTDRDPGKEIQACDGCEDSRNPIKAGDDETARVQFVIDLEEGREQAVAIAMELVADSAEGVLP